MKFRFQPWQLAALLIVLCGALIGVLQWRRASRKFDAARLMASLPRQGAVRFYLDVDQLRGSGLLDLLAGSKAGEESDYQNFVNETGFDYRSDLDAVAASISGNNIYLAVRAHFDWTRLSEYARSQQGQCLNTVCNMPGSQPNRFISFYPLNETVLALAVTPRDRGVMQIAPASGDPPPVPSAPLWISASGSWFGSLGNLPAGASSFLSPLADARETTFSIQPDPASGTATAAGFRLRLDAACASPESAAKLVTQLTASTDLLRSMLARDRQTANPADLSGVLAGGRFESQGPQAIGTWPLDRRFLTAIAAGQ